MLEAINICNFALIDELSLEFEPGLNILTGETGAGKSIIIDALGIALGERASADFLRTGASSARVEAMFTVPVDSPLSLLLDAAGIIHDGHVVLVRELKDSGRNLCRVNGHLVTTTQLKEIAQHLVDIHGQHQHQSLLNPRTHLSFLDAFGGQEQLALAQKVSELYMKYHRLLTALENMEQTERARVQRIDMLQYQIEEIQTANLVSGEWEDLLLEKERLQQRENLLMAVGGAYQLLYGSDRQKGAIDLVGQAQRFLEQVATIDHELAAALEQLTTAFCQLEDLVPKLRRYQENFPSDSSRLNEIEERLELIRLLSRKYGATIDDILAYAAQSTAELQKLQLECMDQSKYKKELAQAKDQLTEAASELADRRRQLAAAFEKRITTELADLAMEKVLFQVSFSSEKNEHGLNYHNEKLKVFATGFDQVEFLLTTNPGETPRPLAKIASGGEIARIMLAIKTVLAGADAVPTLIFDEVDAGIGGQAAQKVADKLAEVSRYHQVICITHLPQIASVGNAHFYIHKKTEAGKTYTQIERLSNTARIKELARMLAGNNVTAVVLQHAKQLLNQGKNKNLP
ncbi:MAG: DNA repair protein RecN [Firmicutes bacterium]|nr:DNA repair protein RecN [Bacillota bacterium]